jgi:hypothetical protein
MIFSMRLSRLLEMHKTYKRILEANKDTPPIAAGLSLISNYFNTHPNSDIAIVNPGGMEMAYVLADELDRRNVMIIHPPPKSRLTPWRAHCDGDMMPDNPLLIVDTQVNTGRAAYHVRNYFEQQGYSRSGMSIYLQNGIATQRGSPMLRSLDDVLRDDTGLNMGKLAVNY